MADLRIKYNEPAVGANHPTFTDNMNRLALQEHYNTGLHKTIHSDDIISKGPEIDIRYFLPAGFVTDGSVDYTTDIQNAFDSIPTSGGVRVIRFPGFPIGISTNININKNNIVILGYGDISLIKTLNNVANFTAMFNLSTSLTDITIKNLALDGNSDNNTLNTTAGIYSLNSNKLIIDNILVKNTPKNGIFLNATTLPHTNFSIRNNRLENIGFRAIQVHKGQVGKIQFNSITSSGNHAIGVTTGTTPGVDSSYEVDISHNRVNRAVPPTVITSNGTEGGFMILLGEASHDCIIDSNILYDNRNANNDGIGTVGSPATVGVGLIYRGIVISNNTVTLAGAFGIDATSIGTVVGNVIDRPGTDGIVIAGDLGPIRKDILIANNIIYNPNEKNISGTAGIALNSAFDTSSTWKRIKIFNNSVVDERATKQVSSGIHINATNMDIRNIEISHNNLSNVLTESIKITNPSNRIYGAIIHDNIERYINSTDQDVWKLLDTTNTPSVLGYDKFYSSGGSNINNFLNGNIGQEIWIVFDSSRTVKFSNANLLGNNQIDWVAGIGDQMRCILDKNSNWRCIIDA